MDLLEARGNRELDRCGSRRLAVCRGGHEQPVAPRPERAPANLASEAVGVRSGLADYLHLTAGSLVPTGSDLQEREPHLRRTIEPEPEGSADRQRRAPRSPSPAPA